MKRIIILDRLDTPMLAFRAALWADVPAARQAKYANVNFASEYADASAPELAALRAGQLAEKVVTLSVEPGTTLPEIRAQLQEAFTAWQTEINGRNPWNRYGTSWDDVSGWTAGGVS